MKLLSYFRSLTARFFHRSAVEDDMEEELRSHIESRAADLERSGLSLAEAQRQARFEFGAHARVKEEIREELGGNFIDTLIQDVRYSLRVLRKSPGFTLAAVFTLAFAIGANSVVFGVLNALILRPLDVPRSENLYQIQEGSGASMFQSYPNYADLHDRSRAFESIFASTITEVGLNTGQDAASTWTDETSGNYFDALGLQPFLGRFYHASDEHGPNSAPYVVLTYAYWHTHFQDDRGVVGRGVRVNKHPFTIIGVAPPGFHGTFVFFSSDIFIPIVNHEQISGLDELNQRGNRWVVSIQGHLKAGVTPAQAIADLNSVGAYLEKSYPKEDAKMSYSLGQPTFGGDFLGRPVRAFVAGLMLLAGLILLAACANLGSLFAARAADRSREVALRLALGASRIRILRTLFTEAMLISIAGGAIGLWSSVLLLSQLSNWQPFSRFPMRVPVNPDKNVYLVALVLALVCGILFGLVPVRNVLRTDPYQIVKAGRTGSPGRRLTLRDCLLAVQIAICAVLVTSSMVAVRGLVRSMHSNFGFDSRNAMLVATDLNMAGYQSDAVPAMQRRMIDALAAVPGVESVGLVDYPPLAMGGSTTYAFPEQATDLRLSKAQLTPFIFRVSSEYFQAARTSLIAGRTLSWHDDRGSQRVAVVNREFARKLFGSESGAVGKYFKRSDGTRVQVVGLVEDGKYLNLAEEQKPAIFLSILQWPSSSSWLVVRSSGDPEPLGAGVRNTLRGLDSGLPLYIQTWNKELDGALFPSRVATVSLGVLGVMGAMLSITGIFGMAAYSVSKRIRELGIRIALGAQPKQVLQSALGRAFKLLAFGSAAGLALGLLATRVLAYIVYHATPRDPLVLTGVVLAMLLLGLIATWIPAQRALRADPLTLLREE